MFFCSLISVFEACNDDSCDLYKDWSCWVQNINFCDICLLFIISILSCDSDSCDLYKDWSCWAQNINFCDICLLFIISILSCDSDSHDFCKNWSSCDLHKDWSCEIQEVNFYNMIIILYNNKSDLIAINLYIFSLKISTYSLSSNSDTYMRIWYLFSDSVLYFC